MKKLSVILIVSAVILSLSFASGPSETNSKIDVSREKRAAEQEAPLSSLQALKKRLTE